MGYSISRSGGAQLDQMACTAGMGQSINNVTNFSDNLTPTLSHHIIFQICKFFTITVCHQFFFLPLKDGDVIYGRLLCTT